MRYSYVTIGPMPLVMIGDVLSEVEAQGWEKDQIVYYGSGIVSMSRLAVMPKNVPPVPLYVLFFKKPFVNDSPVAPPVYALGGKS